MLQIWRNRKFLFLILPLQEANFKNSFKDVGADRYSVEVNFCKEYANDGINPCLDGKASTLIKDETDQIHFENAGQFLLGLSVDNRVVTIEDKTLMVEYEESVIYSVKAEIDTLNEDGVKIHRESTAGVRFKLI